MSGFGFDIGQFFNNNFNLPKLPTYAEREQQRMTLGNLARQGAMDDMTLAEKQRGIESNQAFESGIGDVLKAGNTPEAYAAAAAKNPRAAVQFLKAGEAQRENALKSAKTGAEIAQIQAKTLNEKLPVVGGVAHYLANKPDLTAGDVDAFLGLMQNQGLDPTKFGDVRGDPRAYFRNVTAAALAPKDQIAQAETNRSNVVNEGIRQGTLDETITGHRNTEALTGARDAATAANQRGTLAVSQGNLGVNRDRLQFEKNRKDLDAVNGGGNKAPPGYRWKEDGSRTLEKIPGGPKDGSEKDAMNNEMALSRADLVLEKVGQAKGLVGYNTAGVGGSVLSKVPGTDATDLRKVTDTIKANIGFQELAAMRAASPTGGALGSIAVQELTMLQSVIASLDADQSPAQLKQGLDDVEKHVNNWKNIVKRANNGGGAGASGDFDQPKAPTATEARKAAQPIRNKADYHALPSGTPYIDPQGQYRVKP
jgi:hypothetical protein